MRRLLRLLRRSPGPDSFERRLLDFLHQEYPHLKASWLEPGVLKAGEWRCSTQNLLVRCAQVGQAGERALFRQHFEELLGPQRVRRGEAPLPWDAVRTRLLPQLMPAEYLQEGVALAGRPLLPEVCVGYVVDSEQGYLYVRPEDVRAWGVEEEALWSRALGNLQERTEGVAMKGQGDGERFIALETQDGYDAVRLLLPRLRAFLCQTLGEPFYAGIPSRDFLIAWACDNSDAFQAFARGRVAEHARAGPYPLSAQVLEVTREHLGVHRTLLH